MSSIAMSNVVEAWLNSGKHADIAGKRLRPLEHPQLKGILLAPVRGQAQAFYLQDDNQFDWILKKFSRGKIPDVGYMRAVQPLIPRRPGFQSGYFRQVLSPSDLSRSGYYTADFASWIENTVLMPRIKSDDWASLADKIRTGSVSLTRDERLLFSESLSEQVRLLEASDLSHRDLSAMNVFVDRVAQLVHLIDWDCIFHSSLSMPPNTTFGTEGYTAPFVRDAAGQPDPKVSWRPRADRFSLAILNAEFLSMEAGTPDRNDGGMFNQTELYNRGGPETTRILNNLQRTFPVAAALLEKALRANGFDDCPSPAEWLAINYPVAFPSANFASSPAAGATVHPTVSAPVSAGSFMALNEAAFVRLNVGAFVQLSS
jgi:serine/threonine protein kinase